MQFFRLGGFLFKMEKIWQLIIIIFAVSGAVVYFILDIIKSIKGKQTACSACVSEKQDNAGSSENSCSIQSINLKVNSINNPCSSCSLSDLCQNAAEEKPAKDLKKKKIMQK